MSLLFLWQWGIITIIYVCIPAVRSLMASFRCHVGLPSQSHAVDVVCVYDSPE